MNHRPLLGLVLAAGYLTFYALLTWVFRVVRLLPDEPAWGRRASLIFEEEGL